MSETRKGERRETTEAAVKHTRRLTVEAEGMELKLAAAEKRFGRVVGALLDDEAEKICARCWYRLSRHEAMKRDPISYAEEGKVDGACGRFLPLTADTWRERNG